VKRVARPKEGKVHQEERKPARPIREKVQKVRRIGKKGAAHPAKGEAQQGKWKRSLWEVWRKRAE